MHRCNAKAAPAEREKDMKHLVRAPLIHLASLPGAPVREVTSKGVVGQSTVPTGPQVGTDQHTTHLPVQAPLHIQRN